MFAGVQISQWMATNSYSVNPMRTPYDTMIAYRTSELYSSVTKQAGEVTEVTPHGITVVYENGLEDTFPLGYEVGKGAGEYHKHNKVTDVKVGDKFDAGKVIAWDATFFTRDTLDPNRVNIRLGTMTRIALIEDQFTFEDSVGITKSYADYNSTPYLKLNDFKIDYTQSVKMFIKVGDTVSYDQVLCEIQDEGSAMFDDERDVNMIGLDRLGIKQIKAYQPGKVTKIEVVYNGDLDDASASVKAFITSADATRGKSAKYKKLTATSGNVGGNTSVGKSKVYPGTAVVYIYIENNIVTTVADKFVAGNQMKGTVGYIYEHQIYTVDGRKVDMTFSLKSLLNRMVLSLRDKLVGNEVNAVYTQRMIDKYPRYE